MNALPIIAAVILGCLIVACSSPSQVTSKNETDRQLAPQRLAANDVTLLFPLPTRPQDLVTLIKISDLQGTDGEAVFSKNDFEQIIALAESEVSSIGNRRIQLADSARDFTQWIIAGIRFDPSAPGSSRELIETFGSRPQIRLVLQPVSRSGERIVVHDVTLHVIYDYVADVTEAEPGAVARSIPDNDKVSEIITDLGAIKSRCEALGIDTNGQLSVHPGLKSPQAATVSAAVQDFLQKHLKRSHFNSGAIMALNNGGPEPWIFLSMLRVPEEQGGFIPLPSPGLGPVSEQRFSQMISFIDNPNVQPQPMTTNRSPLSADLRQAAAGRRGVSTATLFTQADLAAAVPLGVDANGEAIVDAELINADIADWVANPEKSHFFNTDCVSCHTESTRRVIMEIPRSRFAFSLQNSADVANRQTMPTNRWNVRNLGWFGDKATISIRTENETLEVVEFINREILGEDL